jgi:hypothetical protein
MKKLLFILIASLTFNMSYAQSDSSGVDSTSTLTQIQEAKGVVSEVVDGIEKISGNVWAALEELAKSLEVPAKHVYNVIVKQQVVNSITNLIIYIIGLSCLYYMLKLGRFAPKYMKTHKLTHQPEYSYEKEPAWTASHIVGFVIFTLGFVVIGIFTFATLNDTVMGFVNPEFGALKDITEMVRTLTK